MGSRLNANLQRFGALSAAEAQAVDELIGASRLAAPGEDMAAEGDPAGPCRVLIEGQAFRHKTLPDGRRQILAFLIPGDIIDLPGVFLNLDHSVTALGACELGSIPRTRLDALMQGAPAISHALWRTSQMELAIAREWMVGMGRRSAYSRIAHLFCEMIVRLGSVGLVSGYRCTFPVTQQHLSDALGLSAVHTNRTLQALRREGLLSFQAGELTVLDWPALQEAGEFDHTYLHLAGRPPRQSLTSARA